ncbi:ImmA/IrrE family metallo-endopeptidase [Desulfobotulus mexicanus]|uniref:ImmA/IrrE family metallo-endopeptidase n=1 Tax=Desulfobotulus mexicanus TaxID=2586642 RepID=A0A5Q4VG79_9BACT|nr:ImmA/IrrE family metallo-endopeptidase [Desulfobotulus mexicanus]
MSNLITDGITYHEADYGASSAGYIQRANHDIRKDAEDKSVQVLYQIIINRNHTREEKFATLAHELGHLYCGHLGSPSDNWWPDRNLKSKEVSEFEAESVAWLVCERMGIKNPSAQYLSGYLDKDNKIPDVSLEAVLRAAGMVEARTLRKFPLRKEIIQDKKY